MLVGLVFAVAGHSDTRVVGAAAQLVGTIIGLVISINIWIRVGRLAIRSEPPSIAGLFKWGKRQWRMLGVALLCFLLVFGPVLTVGIVLATLTDMPMQEALSEPTAGLTFAVFVLLGLAWFLITLGKISFTGPIAANDDPHRSIPYSWHPSRGHTLKLIGGILLTILIMTVGELILLAPAFFIDAAIHDSIYGELVNSLGNAIGGIWITAFASLAYVKLRSGAPA